MIDQKTFQAPILRSHENSTGDLIQDYLLVTLYVTELPMRVESNKIVDITHTVGARTSVSLMI